VLFERHFQGITPGLGRPRIQVAPAAHVVDSAVRRAWHSKINAACAPRADMAMKQHSRRLVVVSYAIQGHTRVRKGRLHAACVKAAIRRNPVRFNAVPVSLVNTETLRPADVILAPSVTFPSIVRLSAIHAILVRAAQQERTCAQCVSRGAIQTRRGKYARIVPRGSIQTPQVRWPARPSVRQAPTVERENPSAGRVGIVNMHPYLAPHTARAVLLIARL